MENTSPFIFEYIDTTRNSRRAFIDRVENVEQAIQKFRQEYQYIEIISVTHRGMRYVF